MKHSMFFLLFMLIRTLKADSSVLQSTAYSNSLQAEGDLYLNPLPDECKQVLDVFAEASANFTKCSIEYARPIRLCEVCINNYTQFNAAYQQFTDTVVDGKSCKSLFISHDRLEAILEYYDNIMSIWDKGHCENCFDWSATSPVLCNKTAHFNKLYKDTDECIRNHSNSSINNTEAVCNTCMEFYLPLDEYYKTLSYDAIGVDSICMDIVDKMNTTRFIWSKILNCCKLRRSPEIVFLVCTGVISFLPILFYLAVRFCGPIRDLPNVLRQSRFKQSLLRSVDGHNSIN